MQKPVFSLIRTKAQLKRDDNYQCQQCGGRSNDDGEDVVWVGTIMGNGLMGHATCYGVNSEGYDDPSIVRPPRVGFPRADDVPQKTAHPQQSQAGAARVAGIVSEVILEIAAHSGSLQTRLEAGMNTMVLRVLPHDIHGDLRAFYNAIVARVTDLEPDALDIAPDGAGRLQVSCMNLDDDSAIAVIRDLSELGALCESEVEALQQEGRP